MSPSLSASKIVLIRICVHLHGPIFDSVKYRDSSVPLRPFLKRHESNLNLRGTGESDGSCLVFRLLCARLVLNLRLLAGVQN